MASVQPSETLAESPPQTTPVQEGVGELPGDVPAATSSSLRGTLQHATSSAASFLSSARTKTTEFIQARTGAKAGEGPASPPVEEHNPEQHRSAAQVANTLMEAAAGLTRNARENSSAAYQAAVQGLRRLTAPTRKVAAVCKADLRVKPCPQVLLLTCNWVASSGLSSTHLFQAGQPQAQVEALATALEGHLVLLPPDLDPALASAVIMHFLGSLEEPLLTYKLSARWVAAGKALSLGDIGAVGGVLEELPLVNWSTLRLLMETCYRVASQFNVTGMNALALATALAPVLLWHEQAAASATGQPRTSQTQQLADMAAASFQALKSKLVPSQAPGDTPPAPGTTTTDPSSPTAAAEPEPRAEAPPSDEGVVLPASEGPGVPPPKAHVVLDEDEELLVGDAGLFLEHSLAQQQPATGAAPTSGGGGPTRTNGSFTGVKAVLEGDELGGAIAAIEYLILNFDELFVFA